MANLVHIFFNADDEVAFFRALERFHLELYPVRIPPNWKPPRVNADAIKVLPEDAAYLAASELGDVLVDKVKRGQDKGSWRVDEVRSPVIYFERSRTNEEGALLSGKLWAELDVTPQTGRRTAAPDRFRRLFMDVEEWIKKTCRKSDPKGFFIGPAAARAFKEGLVLRDADPKGHVIRPFR